MNDQNWLKHNEEMLRTQKSKLEREEKILRQKFNLLNLYPEILREKLDKEKHSTQVISEHVAYADFFSRTIAMEFTEALELCERLNPATLYLHQDHCKSFRSDKHLHKGKGKRPNSSTLTSEPMVQPIQFSSFT
jgi:hypothetical protein